MCKQYKVDYKILQRYFNTAIDNRKSILNISNFFNSNFQKAESCSSGFQFRSNCTG